MIAKRILNAEGKVTHYEHWMSDKYAVPVAYLREVCEELGFKSEDVAAVEMTTTEVKVTRYLRDENGAKYVWGTEDDPAVMRGFYGVGDMPVRIGEAATQIVHLPVAWPEEGDE